MAVRREEPHEKQAKKIDVDLAREIRRQGWPAHGAAAHVMSVEGCFKSVQALRSTMPALCRLIQMWCRYWIKDMWYFSFHVATHGHVYYIFNQNSLNNAALLFFVT